MGTICSPLIFSCSYFFSLSFFQKDFQSEVEVKNLDTKESYMIHERVVRDSVWLRMTSKDDKTRTCSYSKLSGFGHTIYGKKLTKFYLISVLHSISMISNTANYQALVIPFTVKGLQNLPNKCAFYTY